MVELRYLSYCSHYDFSNSRLGMELPKFCPLGSLRNVNSNCNDPNSGSYLSQMGFKILKERSSVREMIHPLHSGVPSVINMRLTAKIKTRPQYVDKTISMYLRNILFSV